MIVMKRQVRPDKNTMSAMFSYRADLLVMLRIERNDMRLAAIKRIVATAVHSSIKVVPFSFSTFNEVSTRKQMPNRLAEVLSI